MRIDVKFKCSAMAFLWRVQNADSYPRLYDFLAIDENNPQWYTFKIHSSPRDNTVKLSMNERYKEFIKCIAFSQYIKSFTVTKD